MKLRGEDVVDGLREWIKAELKEGPKQGYDLGKFFFSVSAGTVAALVGIEVRVIDDCGAPLKTGAVGVSFSSGDPALSLIPLGDGRWTGTWQPRSGKPQQEEISPDEDRSCSHRF